MSTEYVLFEYTYDSIFKISYGNKNINYVWSKENNIYFSEMNWMDYTVSAQNKKGCCFVSMISVFYFFFTVDLLVIKVDSLLLLLRNHNVPT